MFAQYGNTFIAFCELINNSLQAGAKNIYITIEQNRNAISPTLVTSIVIKDDGHGVAESEFDNRICTGGTDVKIGGKGIGRFSALQIGSSAEIETVAFDEEKSKFTQINLNISEELFKKSKNLSEILLNSRDKTLDGKHDTYYQVTINDLYSSTVTDKEKKKKLDPNLLIENIQDAVFTRYPIKIFNKEVKFYINREYVV